MASRHVRSDWRLLEPPGNYGRVRTLCKVTTTPNNCGIPGITRESIAGWCPHCIKKLAAELNGIGTLSLSTLQSLYNVIAAEVGRCLGKESSVLPLWHPHSESINNRRWLVWDVMMSRCYDMNNSDFPHWGGNGVTVHEDWHDFTQFADDVPDKITGVYPRLSREMSKADSTIRVEPST